VAAAEVPEELRYDIDLSALPGEVASRFVRLAADDETRAWLDANARARHGRLATWTRAVATRFLDDFEVNGLLGMHDMFLASAAQWRELLGDRRGGRLLDVGAGDGHVTARLAPLFDEVVAVETSKALGRRLTKRGFGVHVGDLGTLVPGRFDVVALLNLLDRVHQPTALVREARDRLAEGGRLVIATPLPFDPFVFQGPRTVDPVEHLHLDATSFETALASLLEVLLLPAGLTLEAFSRVPYLSRGDTEWDLYARDDVLLVLGTR
jgi:SAM-dependent methyltransferase